MLPLPQDETLWDSLHLVFATASGNVRRNRLSDFRNVRAAGLIAMKLDEGDRLIGVATCREGDDVLLATRKGRCIRFQLSDDTVRVFAGRDSSGVRGIRLAEGRRGDQPVGAAACRGDATTERAAYLEAGQREAARQRQWRASEAEPDADGEEPVAEVHARPRRASGELEEAEEILLTVTDAGFGKRSSAYEYRVTGRGGQGIANITAGRRAMARAVVATFPVRPGRRRDAGDRCRPADPRAGRPGAHHRAARRWA